MFYLLCLLTLGAGTYLYNFGFKQKSTVVKIGGSVVAIGAAILIILSAIYGHVGKGRSPMCPMMMEMQKNMGNVEIQRPPVTPDKYHQPVKHLMTDPMEAKPTK